MTWVWEHLGDIGGYAVSHALLAGIPLLVGLLIALPLGWLARRYPPVASVIVGGSSLLYTIPSLALFILMPLVLGSRILDAINVYVAMTIYTAVSYTHLDVYKRQGLHHAAADRRPVSAIGERTQE